MTFEKIAMEKVFVHKARHLKRFKKCPINLCMLHLAMIVTTL